MDPNTWVNVCRDADGARRHSSFRYVPDLDVFLLWGYLSYDVFIYGGPHIPRTDPPEYGIVVYDPDVGRWENHLPFEREAEWRRRLPPMYPCRNYHGITTGSYRPQLKVRDGVLRPDLNIVFDQVTYDVARSQMVYVTGGRTFGYDVRRRAWSDLARGQGPPPVLGGSLCADPFNDEIILFGGGHVAERGPHGGLVGYTGTWIYACDDRVWRPLESRTTPPPRMATRMVCDTRNRLLVLFGGDGQTHYLADTWVYDTRTRRWRESGAPDGPPPRAGHFTVYDPSTGWVIVGGGHNRRPLTDMWAYDASENRWFRLKGKVPVGWHVTADIRPEDGLIVLTTAKKHARMKRHCDELFLVRTTYAFRIDGRDLVDEAEDPVPHAPLPKRSRQERTRGTRPNRARREAQSRRLAAMPHNTWVLLEEPGRAAPLRTWGSCTFDTDRGEVIYWGGGHCGYGGNDYDFYSVAEHTWVSSPSAPDYPSRAWHHGVNLAGVTFSGAPWMRHGRKVYAYDPVSRKVINTKGITLTAGYEPDPLRNCEPRDLDFGAGEDFRMSGYTKWVTWSYHRETEAWDLVCSGHPGLDLTVTTPHGVMAVDYDWGAVDTAARADRAERQGQTLVENAVYLLDVAGRRWRKLSGSGPWPQNLYEMTSLVYDSRRDRLILHGGGPDRDELWTFDLAAGTWSHLEPDVRTPDGRPPVCRREAVYLSEQDVLLTGSYPAGDEDAAGIYVYRVGENAWHRAPVPAPPGRGMKEVAGQNRAMTCDPERDLVLMLLGEGRGNMRPVMVYALKYRSDAR